MKKAKKAMKMLVMLGAAVLVSTAHAQSLAMFDVNDTGSPNQTGWAALAGDAGSSGAVTDSATTNGITCTFLNKTTSSVGGRAQYNTTDTAGSSVPDVVSDWTWYSNNGIDHSIHYIQVTLDGLTPNAEHTLRWYHYAAGNASTRCTMGIYLGTDNSVATGTALVPSTGLYNSGSGNYYSEFTATADGSGQIILKSGDNQVLANATMLALNGIEVVSGPAAVATPGTLIYGK